MKEREEACMAKKRSEDGLRKGGKLHHKRLSNHSIKEALGRHAVFY